MRRARNLCLRFGLVLVILFSSTLSSSVLTPAQELQKGPSGDDHSLSGATISAQGDINVLDAELQNVRVEQGLPVGEVVLRNQHPLWYIVSQSGLAISGSKLQSWVILPPCRAKMRLIPPGTDYDCTKSMASLGRMPLRNGEEVALFADGVGADDLAKRKLAMIYGAEVFWRLVLKDDLPLDVGTALSDVAFKVADWDLQALGKNLPIFTFYKIGKAFSDNDPLQMVSEINGALSDSAFRGFLETQLGLSKGALPSGLSTIDIALRIEKVLELPLIFGIEGVTSVGKPFGTIRLTPYIPGSTAVASPTTPATRPLVGKWRRLGDGFSPFYVVIEFGSDGRFRSFEDPTANAPTFSDDYEIIGDDALQIRSDSGFSRPVRFEVNGDQLILWPTFYYAPRGRPADWIGPWQDPTPVPFTKRHEYQRVFSTQPAAQAATSPAQATIAAQATQIAALQTAVARQANVAATAARPTASTPVPTARSIPSNFAAFRSTVNPYQIYYPADWRIVSNPANAGRFPGPAADTFFPPDANKVMRLISITTEPINSWVTLESYKDNLFNQSRSLVPNTGATFSPKKIDGRDAWVIEVPGNSSLNYSRTIVFVDRGLAWKIMLVIETWPTNFNPTAIGENVATMEDMVATVRLLR